jgi:hypothetical protein
MPGNNWKKSPRHSLAWLQDIKMDSKLKGSPHHFLAQLAGGWIGATKLWIEPGIVADESPVQGSIQLVLEGRFALYLYQGSIEGEPQHGIFTFGYNTTLDRYEASWVDSFHNNTAIMRWPGKGEWFPGAGSISRSHGRTRLGLAHGN